MRDFKDHLADFFRFYANYNYEGCVMSTHYGISISRNFFSLNEFKIDKPMCLAGPVKKNYNNAYDIGQKRLNKFINICKNAEELIENNF